MIVAALNSPPDTFNICIIVESCHTSCLSLGSVFFFSVLHVPCNFFAWESDIWWRAVKTELGRVSAWE